MLSKIGHACFYMGCLHPHADTIQRNPCFQRVQLQRLMVRDGSTQADAQARIDSQLPLAQKERLAHVVIRNDGDLQQLQDQVRGRWRCSLDTGARAPLVYSLAGTRHQTGTITRGGRQHMSARNTAL